MLRRATLREGNPGTNIENSALKVGGAEQHPLQSPRFIFSDVMEPRLTNLSSILYKKTHLVTNVQL